MSEVQGKKIIKRERRQDRNKKCVGAGGKYGGGGKGKGEREQKRRGEITLKPLISCGQTLSLCQGETQSEGQGPTVPLQPAMSLRSSYHLEPGLLNLFSLGPK